MLRMTLTRLPTMLPQTLMLRGASAASDCRMAVHLSRIGTTATWQPASTIFVLMVRTSHTIGSQGQTLAHGWGSRREWRRMRQ